MADPGQLAAIVAATTLLGGAAAGLLGQNVQGAVTAAQNETLNNTCATGHNCGEDPEKINEHTYTHQVLPQSGGAVDEEQAGESLVVGKGTPPAGTPSTLYHYTNESGMNGIIDSGSLNPSLKALNPNDVRYGNGQYLSDISPDTLTPAQLSRAFINNPFQGARYTNFVAVDVSGLNVIQGRPGVFVIPNETPLDLTGRIVGSGTVKGK
ncbi:HYD1 signature containing ADP-ribosyltransferase family protein (plasmid) [Paraburkholderia sp. PREW-6R]|uniref:HYD1 signature containing ADP-ribosyltransferase family protein n=1 Tax=Paraburkholderia sp. PREW-6R TaxID=3141544 RepID=UPI0031F52C87